MEGSDNYVLGRGATDLAGATFGGNAPIAQTSVFGDDNFAPVFNQGGGVASVANSPASGVNYQGAVDYFITSGKSGGLAPYSAEFNNAFNDWIGPIAEANGVSDWYGGGLTYDMLAQGPAPAQAAAPSQSVLSPSVGNTSNFGGAVQGSGVVGGVIAGAVASGEDSIAQQGNGNVAGDNFGAVVTAPIVGPAVIAGGDQENVTVVAGNVSAPIASGPDSIAQQVGSGSVAVAGDAEDVVNVTGPVAGPIVTGDDGVAISTQGPSGINAGGDVETTAPIVTGVTGDVSIIQNDAGVLEAALEANRSVLSDALSTANSALSAVADSRKDPNERVTNSALYTIGAVILGVAALATLARRRAA